MAKRPYLDDLQTARLWAKVKEMCIRDRCKGGQLKEEIIHE